MQFLIGKRAGCYAYEDEYAYEYEVRALFLLETRRTPYRREGFYPIRRDEKSFGYGFYPIDDSDAF